LGKTKYIKVSEETHQALTDLGRKGESYDAIIRRLIEKAKEGINETAVSLFRSYDPEKKEAKGR